MRRTAVPLHVAAAITFTFLFCSLTPIRSTNGVVASTDGSQGAVAFQAVNLVINEYLADPPVGPSGDANGDGVGNATQDEFVELVNAGSDPLAIGAFTISDATSVRFTFPAGKVIPPGEATVVFGGGTPTGSFGNASANGLVFAAGGSGLSLNNGGDTITVKDGTAAIVATLTYGSSEGGADQSITRSPDVTGGFVPHSTAAGSEGRIFSPGTRVNGRPMVSPDPVINSISPTFTVAGQPVSLTVNGQRFENGAHVRIDGVPVITDFGGETLLTAQVLASQVSIPGVRSITVENPDSRVSNSAAFTVLAPVGINEYLADPPDGAAGDANGDGTRDSSDDEFVELINRTTAPFSIGGFTISDATQLRLTFPAGTVIPAGEAAVVFGGPAPHGEFGNAAANGLVFVATLSLNNSGDTITLRDGSGSVVESISFGSSEGGANQSINRRPEITGSFVTHTSIPESAGRLFSPGTRVDGSPFTIGPRITSIAPDRAPRGTSPFDVTIHGSGFENSSVAFVGPTAVDTRFHTDGEVEITVPANIASVAGDRSVVVQNEGGNRSNAAILTIIPPAPTITQLVPRFVDIGSPSFGMVVLGFDFESHSTVLVEGAAVATQFRSSADLAATVPASVAAALGTRRVQVRNSDGQLSNELALTVVPVRPKILSLVPDQVAAGSAGLQLKVNGIRFTSSLTVFFDQSPLPTTFVSVSEVRADLARELIADPGTHAITVQSGDGPISDEAAFHVNPIPPVINSISPASVAEGSGDARVAIAGDKFKPGATVRVIQNLAAGDQLATEIVSEQLIRTTVPGTLTRTPGRILLRVENVDRGISNSVALDVLIKDPIVINEYLADPPDGAAGDSNGDGARSSSQDEFVEIVNRTPDAIDVSGYKLLDADAVRHVFAAGTLVPPFEAIVVFGGGSPKGEFGNASENRLVFAASTGGLSLGNTGDTIRLEDASGHVVQEVKYGSLEGGAGQSINRQPDANGAVFALHTGVALDLRRLFSPGTKATGESFTIKPAIQSFSPPNARAGSGAFVLTIHGVRLLNGSVAFFGDAALQTTWISESEIDALVTQELIAEGGKAELRVRNPRGELSSPVQFTIIGDPPQISSITPGKTGTGAENFEVSVTGAGFQRAVTVTVDGESVGATRTDATHLTVVLPAKFFTHAAALSLRVVNGDGNVSNPIDLVVENGPLITRVPRQKIKAVSAAVEMEIGGLAFQQGVLIFINDQSAPISRPTETSVVVRIPSAMTAQPGELLMQARNPDGGRSNKVRIKVVQ